MASARDRHGRGLRGRLAPRDVPIIRTPGQRFDDVLLDVVEHLESHGISELTDIDFAVEDVPPVPADDGYDESLLTDADVPLARSMPAQEAGAKPLVLIYRRPLEVRAFDPDDLEDLLHDVVVDRVARLLGRDPEDLDPHA